MSNQRGVLRSRRRERGIASHKRLTWLLAACVALVWLGVGVVPNVVSAQSFTFKGRPTAPFYYSRWQVVEVGGPISSLEGDADTKVLAASAELTFDPIKGGEVTGSIHLLWTDAEASISCPDGWEDAPGLQIEYRATITGTFDPDTRALEGEMTTTVEWLNGPCPEVVTDRSGLGWYARFDDENTISIFYRPFSPPGPLDQGLLARLWGGMPPGPSGERKLIVEVLSGADEDYLRDIPLHDAPVKVVRIADGVVIAEGVTGPDGRTATLTVPTSSSESGLPELRVETDLGADDSYGVQSAFADRWSDIPPELLRPSDEPRLYTVFLEWDAPPLGKLVVVDLNFSGSCTADLRDVLVTDIKHWGDLPTDGPLMYADQKVYSKDYTALLRLEQPTNAGSTFQVPEETSITIDISDIAIIDLEPDTLLKLPCVAWDPGNRPEEAAGLIQGAINLFTGKAFAVKTRDAVAGTRGTEFSVEANEAFTRVSVYEGAVEVTPVNPSLSPVTLQAGEQVTVSQDELSPVTPIEPPPPPVIQAPNITFVGIPDTLLIDTPTAWQLGFSDPNGDINLIRFEQLISGGWQLGAEGDPQVQGQTQGTIGIETTCRQLGIVRARVTLFDAAGNSSGPTEYSYECASGSPMPPPSQAPTITSVGIPSELIIDMSTSWQLGFSDPDADIVLVKFERLVSGDWQPAGEFDPEVRGQTQGTIGVQTTCRQPGPVQARVTLYDAAGNSSDPTGYSYECVSRRTTPPSEDSVAKALDINSNGYLDDSEIRQAVQYWILEETVPGTDQTISDQEMLELIQLWILGEPISSASLGQYPEVTPAPEPLVVEAVSLYPNPLTEGREAVIEVHGAGIAGIELEIFDLTGRRVFDQRTPGSNLYFQGMDNAGLTLANGVYLYVVTARGFDGQIIRSEVRKLILMR